MKLVPEFLRTYRVGGAGGCTLSDWAGREEFHVAEMSFTSTQVHTELDLYRRANLFLAVLSRNLTPPDGSTIQAITSVTCKTDLLDPRQWKTSPPDGAKDMSPTYHLWHRYQLAHHAQQAITQSDAKMTLHLRARRRAQVAPNEFPHGGDQVVFFQRNEDGISPT